MRKKCQLLLLSLLGLLFVDTLQGQVTPVPLTSSSFNFDCVAEASPPSSYVTGSMPGGDVIYSSTYPGVGTTGMPASNTISNSTVTYNLQPYTGNNALQLENFIGSTGDMTFQTPISTSKLHFAAFSVFGNTSIDIVVTFADATTEQIATNFIIVDWFNSLPIVHTLNGRVSYNGLVYNLNSGNPRIYTYDFNISAANQSKLITKATITRTGGPSSSKPYFFAISEGNSYYTTSTTSNVTCGGGSDGSVFVTVTGGTAPYSDGTNSYATDTFTISGLSAGPFAYTITDANGETTSISDTISEPPVITISLDNSTDVTCSGGSDGSLSISASGGSGGANVYISEVGPGSPDFIEITSNGTIDVTGYQVVVSNSYTSITTVNTLTWTLSGTMTANTPMYREDVTGSNYWGNNLFWNTGSSSWAIIIDPSGNIVDALFWGWSAADIANFSITVGGLTVTNNGAWTGNGFNATCANTYTRVGTTDTNTDADWSCITESKGTNNLTITGGSGTAIYTWSSGQTTDSIVGLTAGTYIVTVSDGGSCSVVDSFVVGTAVDNTMPTVITQDITVNLDANGNATIVSGDINNGSTDNCSIASATLDINSFTCANVGANTVTLTITDGSGNANTGTATVTVQDLIAPTVTTQDITVNLDASGNATIAAADVVTASNDNCSIASTTLDITSFTDLDVGANTVTVTVTDASGNTATETAIVTIEYAVNTTGIKTEDILITAYPNPARDFIRLKMTNINEPSVLATLLDINGRIISTHQLETNDAQMDISNLPQGNYFIRIQTKEVVKTVKFVKQ